MKNALLLLLFLGTIAVHAQTPTAWNNKKCAVVLTYDDAVDSQLDNAIPALDSLNLKATFYLSVNSSAFSGRVDEWVKAAKKGHELGNHTMYHPCSSGLPGREWVRPDNDLSKYTVKRITDEIKATNKTLEEVDGKKERTFAYPCGDMSVGDTSYVDVVKSNFICARGVVSNMLSKNDIDFTNIDSYAIHGQTAEELIALVENAKANNKLIVFMFHGVGGGHSLNVDLQAHSGLLHYLKKNEKDIWIAPLIDVVKFIKQK